MDRINRRSWSLFAVAYSALIMGMIAPAFGTSLTWNGSTGSAATSTKWSPQQQPVAADDLFFPGATTFSITFDGIVPSVTSHTYRNTVNATLSITSPHTVSGAFSIGTFSGDNPTVHLGTGALTVDGNAVLGTVNGSTGTLTIDGSDATLTLTSAASDFIAGSGGDGFVTVTGGGKILAEDDFQMGSLSTGNGTVTVTGGTGSLPNVHLSTIGTNSATNGDIIVGNIGSGTLNLQSGGLAHSSHDVKIASSSLSSGNVTLTGAFSIFGSRLSVDRNLDIARNDSIVAAAGTGSVTVNSGTFVNVLGATRIGDAQGGTGTLTLASGFISSANPIDIQSNGTIAGTGTINADISNLGSIAPTGVNGMTINGVLSNTTSNQIVGTKIIFGPNGGYTGSGTCDAAISGDATSTITATGTLSIGNNTTTGFSYIGALDIGGNIVTLVDSNGAVLGGLTTMNSGRIECLTGIGIQNGGTLKGDGLLEGTLTDSGVIDPHTNGPFGGLITLQGNLIMNPTGVFDMEIGGAPPSSNNDRMNITGAATFDGTMRVSLKNGYIPHVGEQFIAINATAGRSGTFANLLPPSGGNAPCNNVSFVLVYSSTAVIVLIRPPLGCTALGDLNSDGAHDGKDIQLFVNALTNGVYDSCADMNGDCLNDLNDIPIMLNSLL